MQEEVAALRDGLCMRVDGANLALGARHEVVVDRPDNLTSDAQRVRACKTVERHGNRALERVLHGHERSVHCPCLHRMQTLTDVGIADDLAIELLPLHEIERRRLAVRPHGTEHAHFLTHTHSSS